MREVSRDKGRETEEGQTAWPGAGAHAAETAERLLKNMGI